MAKFKVHFTGGEGINWAIDHNLRHLVRLSAEFVEVVPLDQAEIIHTLFWHSLLSLPRKHLQAKCVVASIADKPEIAFSRPEYLKLRELIDVWLCEYYESLWFVSSCGLPCQLFPEPIDLQHFVPPADRQASTAALKARLGIPADRYLIGNFHRDTAGADLSLPKKQKGADVLLEIATLLRQDGAPIHVLLAGPRRHWIRRGFQERGIPYTFLGTELPGDDLKENTLSHDEIATLFPGLDAYVISSRWEGAPNTLLECAATKTCVVSTRVGQSQAILTRGQIFDDAAAGAALLMRDVRERHLTAVLESAYEHVHKFNSYEATAGRLKCIYEQARLNAPPKRQARTAEPSRPAGWRALLGRRAPAPLAPDRAQHRAQIAQRVGKKKSLTFALWNDFKPPPYGGGNQFLIALEGALQRKGMRVIRNSGAGADAHVVQSIWFDRDQLRREREPGSVVIHRIDGPIQLYRGTDGRSDDLCYEVNREIADVTIMQSSWSMRKTYDLGYRPVRPVLMWNSCDSQIFNREGRGPFERSRKIRLISTSWSDNPRKGRATYEWMDEHLDWSRYEYMFVGRMTVQFRHIRTHPPVDSETLAGFLKQHDIYITASQNDPCSNALVEALSCGLPAAYFHDGGHPELVGFGGIGFRAPEEIPGVLERLVEAYAAFQRNIWVDGIDELAQKYVDCVRLAGTLD
jgi:glycosyltransferase involved in cell wall biosynthesis